MSREERIGKKQEIATKYRALAAHLNERTRRLWAATEAIAVGYGGISIVADAIAIDRNTIRAGMHELSGSAPVAEIVRIRRVGGGRKKLVDTDHILSTDLNRLVDPETRGDPESPLRWTTKSVERIAAALQDMGHRIGRMSVSTLLHAAGYSLHANRKRYEGTDHPDRDAQFQYINTSVEAQQKKRQPCISVDTKKKELVGNFKNNGREWYLQGRPLDVNMHDFTDSATGKVIPYGVYDLSRDAGWVNVGITHDTAQFAVESIRRWWRNMGSERYPDATELLITADCGGSNGRRSRLWKRSLQELSDETGLAIHVRHFPPGTSKWNKIEHRLFSFISRNWRGQPLLDRATVVNLIAHTKTKTGLTVRATMDENVYVTGVKVSDAEFAAIKITTDAFHGEWNYTIGPREAKTA